MQKWCQIYLWGDEVGSGIKLSIFSKTTSIHKGTGDLTHPIGMLTEYELSIFSMTNDDMCLIGYLLPCAYFLLWYQKISRRDISLMSMSTILRSS